MNIDTQEVLDAAETKWNFLPFKPGLVGGHCIGVDPYYLTYKANDIGYTPKIILAGRKINDNMDKFIVSKFIDEMKNKSIKIKKAKVLIMGLTFKENCTDIRNSGSKDLAEELIKLGCELDLYDPMANEVEIKNEYNIQPLKTLTKNTYDGIIIAVAHNNFKNIKFEQVSSLCKKKNVIFDLKHIFSYDECSLRL